MPTDVALEVRGLTKKFGSRHAVRDLDLTVREGDIYGFLGPNGAGKTTAMRCVVGLMRRDAGTVTLFGETGGGAMRHVGALIETPTFHGWRSGRKNLEEAAAWAGLAGAEAAREIDRVLEVVGLVDRAKDRAGTYSLGMRQRLGIARALLGRPKLLMLDEPTNGLDPRGMREVRELLRSLALHERLTVFVSSHLLGEVQQICNRVGIIHDAVLRAEGDVADLLSSDRVRHVVEVAATDLDALRAAASALDSVEVIGAGEAGRVRIAHAGMPVDELNRRLVGAGVGVTALVPVARDLEEVFLEMTS